MAKEEHRREERNRRRNFEVMLLLRKDVGRERGGQEEEVKVEDVRKERNERTKRDDPLLLVLRPLKRKCALELKKKSS